MKIHLSETEFLKAELKRLQDDMQALAAPVQEPIAFFHPNQGFYWARPTKITAPATVDVEPLPLYTTPPAQPAPVPCCGKYETCTQACTPRGKFLGAREAAAQRPWLDLTDEQIKAIEAMALTKNMAIAMTMRTLKEKNTWRSHD
jgi:hypothetical protein